MKHYYFGSRLRGKASPLSALSTSTYSGRLGRAQLIFFKYYFGGFGQEIACSHTKPRVLTNQHPQLGFTSLPFGGTVIPGTRCFFSTYSLRDPSDLRRSEASTDWVVSGVT